MKKILSVIFVILGLCHLHGDNVNWSSPAVNLSGLDNASHPRVVIDTNGDVVAAWIENGIVKSRAKPFNGNWSSEVSISGTNASELNLVSDINGNVTALWIESGIVKAISKPLNQNWGSSTSLSSNNASYPTLCVGPEGDVLAAWVRGGNVETSTKRFGFNWQSRTIFNSNNSSSPSVAIGGTGSNTRAVVLWQNTLKDGTYVISASSKLIASSWSNPEVLSDAAHNAAKPSVALDSNGNAIAIWYAYDINGWGFSNVVLQTSARSALSGSWDAISDLSSPGIRNPSTLFSSIAFDTIGNAIALWNTSFDDDTFSVQSAIKSKNGLWSNPTELIHSNLYANAAHLSVTNFGEVLGLYLFYNGQSLLIQSIESNINGYLDNVWSTPVTISQGIDNAYPKIAAAVKGNTIVAVALWLNFNGTINTVMSTTGSKTLVLPPSDLHITQHSNNFGSFLDYYNTLSWNASVDPNVAGYLIFRNGLFIGQVGADVLQFVDNNRVQNGSVKYSVTAVDNQQAQSNAISATFP